MLIWQHFDLAQSCVEAGMEWVDDSCIKRGNS